MYGKIVKINFESIYVFFNILTYIDSNRSNVCIILKIVLLLCFEEYVFFVVVFVIIWFFAILLIVKLNIFNE